MLKSRDYWDIVENTVTDLLEADGEAIGIAGIVSSNPELFRIITASYHDVTRVDYLSVLAHTGCTKIPYDLKDFTDDLQDTLQVLARHAFRADLEESFYRRRAAQRSPDEEFPDEFPADEKGLRAEIQDLRKEIQDLRKIVRWVQRRCV
jgi:hypothetical protein